MVHVIIIKLLTKYRGGTFELIDIFPFYTSNNSDIRFTDTKARKQLMFDFFFFLIFCYLTKYDLSKTILNKNLMHF